MHSIRRRRKLALPALSYPTRVAFKEMPDIPPTWVQRRFGNLRAVTFGLSAGAFFRSDVAAESVFCLFLVARLMSED